MKNKVLIIIIIVLSTLYLSYEINSIQYSQITINKTNIINNYNETRNYWQNVLPSKQCDDVPLDDMYYEEYYGYATGSMRPYLFEGDGVLFIDYNPEIDLVVGDIVSDGDLLHRIIAIDYYDQWYEMKGDNNKRMDAGRFPFNNTKWVICGVLRRTK